MQVQSTSVTWGSETTSDMHSKSIRGRSSWHGMLSAGATAAPPGSNRRRIGHVGWQPTVAMIMCDSTGRRNSVVTQSPQGKPQPSPSHGPIQVPCSPRRQPIVSLSLVSAVSLHPCTDRTSCIYATERNAQKRSSHQLSHGDSQAHVPHSGNEDCTVSAKAGIPRAAETQSHVRAAGLPGRQSCVTVVGAVQDAPGRALLAGRAPDKVISWSLHRSALNTQKW